MTAARETLDAIREAMRLTADRHRLSQLVHVDAVRAIEDHGDGGVTTRLIVGDLRIGPSAYVRAHLDGEVSLHLRPDGDVDYLRAALIARDLHRACGRELALIAGDPASTDGGPHE